MWHISTENISWQENRTKPTACAPTGLLQCICAKWPSCAVQMHLCLKSQRPCFFLPLMHRTKESSGYEKDCEIRDTQTKSPEICHSLYHIVLRAKLLGIHTGIPMGTLNASSAQASWLDISLVIGQKYRKRHHIPHTVLAALSYNISVTIRVFSRAFSAMAPPLWNSPPGRSAKAHSFLFLT